MKKIVYMFVASAAISLGSCGNRSQNLSINYDSIPQVEKFIDSLSNAIDSVKTDSIIQ